MKSYYESQLNKVVPKGNGIALKIKASGIETDWLGLSEEQYEKVKELILQMKKDVKEVGVNLI